jgi:hypothetical protein
MLLNRMLKVEVYDPSGLRPQISNKLRLFLICAPGKLPRYCLIARRNLNGASQQKFNQGT